MFTDDASANAAGFVVSVIFAKHNMSNLPVYLTISNKTAIHTKTPQQLDCCGVSAL